MSDVGVIRGAFVLDDHWSGVLDHGIEKLDDFKSFGEKAFGAFGEAGEKIGESIGGITDKLGSLAESGGALGPLGIGLAAVAVSAVAAGVAVFEGAEKCKELANEAIKAGGEMLDLSHKTHLSVETLQDLKAISSDTGVPLEAMTNSIFKLEQGIGSGSAKMGSAISDLGLSFNHLKDEKPEEAFNEIMAKLRELPSAAQQAADGQAIFGKGFRQMKGLLLEDTDEIVKNFHEMGGGITTEMAVLADNVGDSQTRIAEAFENLKIRIGSLFLPVVGAALDKFQDAWKSSIASSETSVKDFQGVVDTVMMFVVNVIAGFVGGATRFFDDYVTEVETIVKATVEGVGIIATKFSDTSSILGKFFSAIGDKASAEKFQSAAQQIQGTMDTLRDKTKALFDGIHAVDQGIIKFADNMHMTQGQLDAYKDKLATATANEKAWKDGLIGSGGALANTKDKTKSLADELDKLIERGQKYATDLTDGTIKIDALGNKQKEVNKALLEAAQAMEAEGKAGDPLHATLLKLAMQTENWTTFTGKAGDAVKMLTEASVKQNDQMQKNYFTFIQNTEAMVKLKDGISGLIGLKVASPVEEFAEKTKLANEQTQFWTGNLRLLTGDLSELGNSFGGVAGDIFKAAADIGGALEHIAGSSKEAFSIILNPHQILDVKQAWAGLASAIVGGVAGIAQATSGPNQTQNIIGGALTGAATGAAIATTAGAIIGGSAEAGAAAGPWGLAAGAVVGIFIAVFRGRSTRQEMAKVGQEWGTDISQGLADKIKDTKQQFQGQDIASAVFNMKDIIKEAGGLNELNFNQFIGHMRDVFVMVERGLFSTAQAQHVLDDNFQAFADQVVKSGHIASQAFQEIIQLNASSGVYAKSVLDFVDERTQFVGTSLAALSQPLLDSITAWQAAGAAAADANGELPETDAELKALVVDQAQHAKFVADSAAELADLGVIAVGAFGAARKAGLDFVDAVNAIGPGLDNIIKAQQMLGITQEDNALASLEHFRDEVNQNQNLVKGAEALNDTMLGLSQIGGLNADTLKAMENQGQRTYDRLIDAGFTENEALSVMADYLRDVIDAHVQLGIPIDENTAKLIDQADSYGLLQKDGKSMTDILKDGFKDLTEGINRLITTLGGVPVQFDNIANSINNIPKSVDIDINTRMNGGGDNPDGSQLPQYDKGTNGYKWFGSGTPVVLHGWEKVTPLGEEGPMGSWSVSSPDQSGMGGDGNVNIHMDLRGADVGDFASQTRFAKKVDDAMMNWWRMKGNKIGTLPGGR